MADKISRVLTIDIGGDSLKMAEFSYRPGTAALTLECFAFKNLENQDDDPIGAFEKAYKAMLRENHFQAREARMTISGQASFSRLTKLPPLVGDQASVGKIVEFEARQTVPYAMDEVVWDYQLIKHSGKIASAAEIAEKNAQTPAGAEDAESTPDEEFEALFVAVKEDLAIAYTDIVAKSGKEVLSVGIAPVAMFNTAAANNRNDQSPCDILLNIGGRCTSMVIAENDRAFVRSIPIAGDSITQQISKEFGIEFSEAEEMKRRHGFVALGGAYEEPESEVAATISKIARNVMTRLHGEVSRSINVWRSQHGGTKPTRMWISGGGSMMLYITDFFQEKLHIPVDYLNSFTVIGIGHGVDKEQLLDVAPMFPELIGMGLRSIAFCPVDINLVPNTIKLQRSIRAKRPFFYASCASLIICLCIFYFGVSRRTDFDKRRAAETGARVTQTSDMLDKVNMASRRLGAAKEKYQKTLNIMGLRSNMIELYSGIAEALPDSVYLQNVSLIGTAKSGGASTAEPPRRRAGLLGFGPAAEAPVVESKPKASGFSEVTALHLEGYQLVLDSKGNSEPLDQQLEKKLRALPQVSQDADAVKFEKYNPPRDSNILSFTLRLKLKQPIRMM